MLTNEATNGFLQIDSIPAASAAAAASVSPNEISENVAPSNDVTKMSLAQPVFVNVPPRKNKTNAMVDDRMTFRKLWGLGRAANSAGLRSDSVVLEALSVVLLSASELWV